MNVCVFVCYVLGIDADPANKTDVAPQDLDGLVIIWRQCLSQRPLYLHLMPNDTDERTGPFPFCQEEMKEGKFYRAHTINRHHQCAHRPSWERVDVDGAQLALHFCYSRSVCIWLPKSHGDRNRKDED